MIQLLSRDSRSSQFIFLKPTARAIKNLKQAFRIFPRLKNYELVGTNLAVFANTVTSNITLPQLRINPTIFSLGNTINNVQCAVLANTDHPHTV